MKNRKTDRLGLAGYATILRHLASNPSTAAELRDRYGLSNCQWARELMRRFAALRLVHIGSWAPAPAVLGGDRYVARWHFGPGADAACPQPQRSFRTPPSPSALATAFASVVRALSDEARTVEQVADHCGLRYGTVRLLVNHMKAIGLVYIDDWESGSSRAHVRMFRFGVGKRDKPRPATMTNAERCRRYSEGQRAKASSLAILRALAGNPTTYRESVAA